MTTLFAVQAVVYSLTEPKETLHLRWLVESALTLLVLPTFSSEVVKMEIANLGHFTEKSYTGGIFKSEV